MIHGAKAAQITRSLGCARRYVIHIMYHFPEQAIVRRPEEEAKSVLI